MVSVSLLRDCQTGVGTVFPTAFYCVYCLQNIHWKLYSARFWTINLMIRKGSKSELVIASAEMVGILWQLHCEASHLIHIWLLGSILPVNISSIQVGWVLHLHGHNYIIIMPGIYGGSWTMRSYFSQIMPRSPLIMYTNAMFNPFADDALAARATVDWNVF